MKSFMIAILCLAFGVTAGYFGQPHLAMLLHPQQSNNAEAEKEIEYWVAPMDPNFRRDKAGKSPMGMDLVPVYKKTKPKMAEKEIDYWVAPMDANFRRDKPGKSPMGMDLVPVYKTSGEDDPNAVTIAPEVINNMGVRTAIVKRQNLAKPIETLGYIAYDETKITHIHLKTKGWIEKLYVKAEGENVRRGQVLFEVYSPDLVNAQEEYLRTLHSKLVGLKGSAKTRLASLGMSNGQIKNLIKRGKPYQRISVYAPRSGIISKLNIGEGMYVKPEMNIMVIADLRQVWLMVDVFERQANWVKIGQDVKAYFSYLPEKEWLGKVDYIYPDLNPKTRSIKVRLVFKNLGGQLKPNMYGKVEIATNPKQQVIVIPRQAIIRSGSENHVIIQNKAGSFKQRPIQIGIESKGLVEVTQGLKIGDKIVTSAMFLIDSEASLKASFNRMEPIKEATEMKMDKMNKETMKIEKFNGKGVVDDVMTEMKMITLTHEPIEALGWGKMTMDLKIDTDKVDLTGLKAGESIHFTLEKRPNHQYVIVFIHRMGAM